ncbi:MAG: tetratricopeptide repeat protein [Acidobacteria bacterium]|nr:MAG: tetratricopeptide repeat protein [Acidobacteriota bacterium]
MIVSLVVLGFWIVQAGAAPPDLQQVRNALRSNDIVRAERLLGEIVSRHPRSAEAHHLLGAIRLAQGRYEEAESALRKALGSNPRLAVAYLALADVYEAQNRRDQEQAILAEGLKKAGPHPTVLFRLGVLEAENGELRAALSRFKSIPEKAAPPGYWEAVGKTHVSLGNYTEAETAYRRVLRAAPGSVGILRILSGIALKRGDKQAAWDYIAEARRAAPQSPDVLFQFAQVSLVNYFTAEAVTSMRLVVLMEPDNPEYVLALGNALMDNQDYREAVPVFTKYLELKPGDAGGELMLGEALRGSGQDEQARVHLEKAIAINPGVAEPYYHLGMLAFTAAEDQRAEQLFMETLNRKADHGPACLALGRLHLRRREPQKAVEWLEKARAFVASDPNVPFQLSRAYAALGEKAKAQQALAVYARLNAEREKRDQQRLQTKYTSKRQAE